MAVIGIVGESGSGKTTSLMKLDPATTFYIDADKKGLNWRGWRDQYSKDKLNYYKTDSPSLALNILKKINEQDNMKHVKTVIIDTLNGIMVAEEMRNAKTQGYGKWTDLASYIYDIVDYCLELREDLTAVLIFHSETVTDDEGYRFTRIKTNGRKLDKIVLESKLTTVLFAECLDGRYVFHTHSDRNTAKTPIGAFDQDEIDNDITEVLKALEDF